MNDRLRWLDLVPPLVFTVLGTILIVAVLVGLSRANHAFVRSNLETITLVGTLAVYLAFGAGIAVALRRLHAPVAFLRLRWPTFGDLGLTLLLLVPWYLGIILVSLLSAITFNGGRVIPGNSRLVFIQHPNGIGLLLLALLVTAVAAPVCEEIFFRGMLFRLLESRLRSSGARSPSAPPTPALRSASLCCRPSCIWVWYWRWSTCGRVG